MKHKKWITAVLIVVLLLFTGAILAAANRDRIRTVFDLSREQSKIKDNSGSVIALVGGAPIYESAIKKWELSYEFNNAQLENALTEATSDEAKLFIAGRIDETKHKTENQKRAEIIDRLVQKEKLLQFCPSVGIQVSDEEADAYQAELEAAFQKLIESGNESLKGMEDFMEQQRLGSGLSEEEYQKLLREGYREQLLYQRLYEYYENHNPDQLSYQDWWAEQTADIPVVLY
ncbi:MAG: hypothetical protein DBX52_01785 [Clostridiales bacterium]|nr:MAG: hypothetical protein DBX52_01785 [Clostridiales bacterium]